MPIKQLNLQCAVDNEVTPHNQEAPNHVVHALVSIFLIGLWIPVWIIIAMGAGKNPATCVKCGNRRAVAGAATVSGPAAPVEPTSQKQIVAMFIVMAVVIAGLLAYDHFATGEWNQ